MVHLEPPATLEVITVGFIKKNIGIIALVLFVLWASTSPDDAATAVRKVLGWVFGKFLPGLGDFVTSLFG